MWALRPRGERRCRSGRRTQDRGHRTIPELTADQRGRRLMAALGPRRTNARRSRGALGGDHLPPARAPDVSAGTTGSGTGSVVLSRTTAVAFGRRICPPAPVTLRSPQLPARTHWPFLFGRFLDHRSGRPRNQTGLGGRGSGHGENPTRRDLALASGSDRTRCRQASSHRTNSNLIDGRARIRSLQQRLNPPPLVPSSCARETGPIAPCFSMARRVAASNSWLSSLRAAERKASSNSAAGLGRQIPPCVGHRCRSSSPAPGRCSGNLIVASNARTEARLLAPRAMTRAP